MTIENKIMSARRRAGNLLEEEVKNLTREYKVINRALQDIITSIRANEPYFKSIATNKKTLLQGVYVVVTKAVRECERERRLGNSEIYTKLSTDLKELARRLNTFKGSIHLMMSGAQALKTFSATVTSYLKEVQADFSTRIQQDQRIARELER